MKSFLSLRIPVIVLLVIAACAAISQTAPKPEPPKAEPAKPEVKKTPVVSADLKAKYYRAQLHVQKAQSEMQAAQAEFQSMASDFQKECGEGFQPQVDAAGDPTCMPAPKAPEPPAKK